MLTTKEFESSTISTSEFQRKVGTYLKRLNDESTNQLMITKQNKVEAVILNPDKFDELVLMSERAESLSIALAVEKARNDSKRYTKEDQEVKDIFAYIDNL